MLREQKESGLSVKAWCQERGLAEHIYYYRLRKLRQAACTALEQAQPLQLAEVPLAPKQEEKGKETQRLSSQNPKLKQPKGSENSGGQKEKRKRR